MQVVTFTQLNSALGQASYRTCLKYDPVCLVRRNQQLAYLLPVTEDPDREILKALKISAFRQSIGFHVELLIEASKKHGKSIAYGLTDASSELICYVALELPRQSLS